MIICETCPPLAAVTKRTTTILLGQSFLAQEVGGNILVTIWFDEGLFAVHHTGTIISSKERRVEGFRQSAAPVPHPSNIGSGVKCEGRGAPGPCQSLAGVPQQEQHRCVICWNDQRQLVPILRGIYRPPIKGCIPSFVFTTYYFRKKDKCVLFVYARVFCIVTCNV